MFLIATNASNPEPQSFVMVTVTEACRNSTVVLVPPATGVGLGIGVGAGVGVGTGVGVA